MEIVWLAEQGAGWATRSILDWMDGTRGMLHCLFVLEAYLSSTSVQFQPFPVHTLIGRRVVQLRSG